MNIYNSESRDSSGYFLVSDPHRMKINRLYQNGCHLNNEMFSLGKGIYEIHYT